MRTIVEAQRLAWLHWASKPREDWWSFDLYWSYMRQHWIAKAEARS